MKRIRRTIVTAIVVCLLLTVSTAPSTYAATKHNSAHKSYWKSKTFYSSEYLGDEYTPWKAQNVIFKANRNGETGAFSLNKSVSITTTGSIEVSIPLKELQAKIGYSKAITKSVSSTLYGSNSAPLKKSEMCRHYYREHFKVYKVTEKWRCYCRDCYKYIETKYVTKTIKIPQKITEKDYGWRYSYDRTKLPSSLSNKERLGKV